MIDRQFPDNLKTLKSHFEDMYQKYRRAKPVDPDIEYAMASAKFGAAICDHPTYLKILKRRLRLV